MSNTSRTTPLSEFRLVTEANMHNRDSYGSTIDLLNEVAEFLEGQADVRDGSDGPRPNKAMELMARAEIEIERLKRASLRGPESEAEAACAAMVKWCDKNDWGSVPKKLELQMRKACRATQENSRERTYP
jgi:rhamnose utilization protein RhaD (predicted bifunctional aldolase and dehydrogenase)